jgi:nucleotide-binding universal stress UspA family protein
MNPHRFASMRVLTLGVGYDGSPESEQALAVARELASRSGAVKELMDDELRRLRGLDGVEGDVTYGEPSEELAAFSDGLDLLIVGSRSYGPVGRLFNGSTSNYLARRARCPLLVRQLRELALTARPLVLPRVL